jgi:hypothetical protein
MRTFKRVSHMMDHVEKVHLRHEPSAPSFVCRHPQCKHLGNFLTSLGDFISSFFLKQFSVFIIFLGDVLYSIFVF